MRHRDYSNPLPFRDELLQVFIPRMYYNYRIERRPYDEPAAMLFTSATRKSVIPPPPVRLSWDSRHPPPESVRTDGRTYADVRTKIFRINGLPTFLTNGAPRTPLIHESAVIFPNVLLLQSRAGGGGSNFPSILLNEIQTMFSQLAKQSVRVLVSGYASYACADVACSNGTRTLKGKKLWRPKAADSVLFLRLGN